MVGDTKQPKSEWEETTRQLRKAHTCTSEKHIGTVIWTTKTLGKYCEYKRLQRECRKFCCECCPKRIKEEE